VPWQAGLFQLIPFKWLANCFDFAEREPYGVKDPRVRALVAAAIESGDASKAGMLKVPGGSMFELRELVNAVCLRVHDIHQRVLPVHPREDDRAHISNSFWLQSNLAGNVDMVVLDDSYHVVAVDRQRHVVAERTVALCETVTKAHREGTGKVVPISRPPRSLSQGRVA
jgi:carboxylesterase